MRRWLVRIVIAFLLLLMGIGGVDYWVTASTRAQIYTDITLLPHRKVGLLLGTSRYGKHHWLNYYYKYRIEATVALFRAGKIDYVLISGDNGTKHYNEPEMMQADLIAAGIPAARIVLDYAGFRTLDSILRCRDVFGEDNFVIISQPFHNQRALFIAARKGIHAIAFNAQDVSAQYGLQVQLREKLARVKMMLDLLFHKGPKYYGPHVQIG